MTSLKSAKSPSSTPLRAWFDVRGRRLGGWAFALNRLSGLGLTLYLFLHLFVLRLLLQGEASWDAFIALARSPLFLTLDVILLAGLLIHGLNGVRVTLVGLGVAARQHRTLFWILMTAAALLLLAGGWRIFTI